MLWSPVARDNVQGDVGAFQSTNGHIINYTHPPSIGNYVVIPSLVLLILATMALAARLSARFFIVKKTMWDDFFIVVAWIFAVGRVAANLLNVYQYHTGIHVWDIPPNDAINTADASKNTYFAGDMLYFIAIACTKVSLLLLYLNIFRPIAWFKYLCYFMMAFSCAQSIAWFFVWAFQCNPVYVGWHIASSTLKGIHGTCIDIVEMTIVSGGLFIATDVILLVMPLPMIAKLHISLKRKLALGFVFATGIFAVVSTIVREVIVVRTLRDADQSWYQARAMSWLTIELLVGIICACLPCLTPLFANTKFGALLRSIGSRARSTLEMRGLQRSRNSSTGDIESGGSEPKVAKARSNGSTSS